MAGKKRKKRQIRHPLRTLDSESLKRWLKVSSRGSRSISSSINNSKLENFPLDPTATHAANEEISSVPQRIIGVFFCLPLLSVESFLLTRGTAM